MVVLSRRFILDSSMYSISYGRYILAVAAFICSFFLLYINNEERHQPIHYLRPVQQYALDKFGGSHVILPQKDDVRGRRVLILYTLFSTSGEI